MKIKRKLLNILITFIFIFSSFGVAEAFAQGTYDCVWHDLDGTCNYTNSNCDTSQGCYVPSNPCPGVQSSCPRTGVSCVCTGGSSSVTNPLVGLSGDPVDLMSGLIQLLINIAFVAGAVIFIFMIIQGGIQWMTAGGDKGSVQAAKSRMTNAFVGLLILFSLFFIIDLVEEFFDVSIMSLDFGTLSL